MKDEYIERIGEYEARAEAARLLASHWKRDFEEARKIIEDAFSCLKNLTWVME